MSSNTPLYDIEMRFSALSPDGVSCKTEDLEEVQALVAEYARRYSIGYRIL